MAMYFFVFEMATVKISIEGGPHAIKRAEINRKVKFVVLILSTVYLFMYLTVRMISETSD
jgi:hypothetical protein